MTGSLALLLLLASEDTTSVPRRAEVPQAEARPSGQENPTDPLFDRKRIATDDPAFVLAAIESSRQGILDARSAQQRLRNEKLRDAAEKIGRQNEATRARLEAIAKTKGWRVPDGNSQRETALPAAGETRTAANFIVSQIAVHEATIAQYRAQLDGKGDAELKRALRAQLPGYQENLSLLLALKL
jgi:predicted outer membrane protein